LLANDELARGAIASLAYRRRVNSNNVGDYKMPDTSAVGWFSFLTLFIGYAAKSFEDWIRSRREIAKDRETRRETRHYQRVANRITFQRETLLLLQDAVQKLARATARTNHLDEMAYRKTNEWRKEQLPEDLNDGYFVASTQTALLSSRVRDGSVRQLVDNFRTVSTHAILSETPADARRQLQELMDISNELHGRIGMLIRTIDDDDTE
jgi:hypothetical protein